MSWIVEDCTISLPPYNVQKKREDAILPYGIAGRRKAPTPTALCCRARSRRHSSHCSRRVPYEKREDAILPYEMTTRLCILMQLEAANHDASGVNSWCMPIHAHKGNSCTEGAIASPFSRNVPRSLSGFGGRFCCF